MKAEELISISSMIELKGVFCLENKGNSKKPVISLNSRRKNVIAWVHMILLSYDIKNVFIERKDFATMRITYRPNCKKFFNLFEDYIKMKPANYDLVRLQSDTKRNTKKLS